VAVVQSRGRHQHFDKIMISNIEDLQQISLIQCTSALLTVQRSDPQSIINSTRTLYRQSLVWVTMCSIYNYKNYKINRERPAHAALITVKLSFVNIVIKPTHWTEITAELYCANCTLIAYLHTDRHAHIHTQRDTQTPFGFCS